MKRKCSDLEQIIVGEAVVRPSELSSLEGPSRLLTGYALSVLPVQIGRIYVCADLNLHPLGRGKRSCTHTCA